MVKPGLYKSHEGDMCRVLFNGTIVVSGRAYPAVIYVRIVSVGEIQITTEQEFNSNITKENFTGKRFTFVRE